MYSKNAEKNVERFQHKLQKSMKPQSTNLMTFKK